LFDKLQKLEVFSVLYLYQNPKDLKNDKVLESKEAMKAR